MLRLPPFDLDGSHDIGRIWAHFRDQAPSIDWRYRRAVDELESDISDIAAVDPNGQVFRYPFGRENNKHLDEVAIINCRVLREQFSEIRRKLSELGRLSVDLKYEYSLGTYTARLSRLDLLCIAHMLPPRVEWGSVAFDAAKAEVRRLFDISNREFSRAVDCVQGNREMASLIGAPIPLEHCGPEQLFAFFDAWFKLNDREEVLEWLFREPHEIREVSRETAQEMFSNLERGMRVRAEIWESVARNLSLEAIGELDALFNFYRIPHWYGEEYERERLALTSELRSRREAGESYYRDSVLNFMEKFIVLPDILNSLNFFGHNNLLELLIDRYKLSDHIERLLEDSNRRTECRSATIQEHLHTRANGNGG